MDVSGMKLWLLLLSLLSVASRSIPAVDAADVVGTSRSERGALKIIYWATQGPAWKQRWDIQNEMSDPCVNKVSGTGCRYDSDVQVRAAELPFAA